MKHIFNEELTVNLFLLAEKSVSDFGMYHANLLGTMSMHRMVSDTELELSCREEHKLVLSKKDNYVLYTISDRKVYICQAEYSSEYRENGRQVILFTITSPLQEIQRRMYQRIACRDEIRYQEWTLAGTDDGELFKKQKKEMPLEAVGTMIDIGGGGIRFVSSEEITAGTNLVIRIMMKQEKEEYLYLCGKVVHAEELKNEKGHYDIRMKFIQIEEEEKEKIIQHAFMLERESQQKRY